MIGHISLFLTSDRVRCPKLQAALHQRARGADSLPIPTQKLFGILPREREVTCQFSGPQAPTVKTVGRVTGLSITSQNMARIMSKYASAIHTSLMAHANDEADRLLAMDCDAAGADA